MIRTLFFYFLLVWANKLSTFIFLEVSRFFRGSNLTGKKFFVLTFLR